MKSNDMSREQISAFADGEMDTQGVDHVLHDLRDAEQQSLWGLYHGIGDVLRSDEMAIDFSPGFSARMAARLNAEPSYLGPAALATPLAASLPMPGGARTRRFMLPGLAAAAAAAAYFAVPQLMVASAPQPAATQFAARATGTGQTQLASLVVNTKADHTAATTMVVLRDPRIDEYLLAHQRFSPSLYSSAQFARSATFASDANK
ncbi:MAG: sigma-E factor negative regulatory protein [Pseudomonadota bacterium]|nr:sigma-E factor negative regulatory protein [Pseudomonadota bacterium]